MYERLTDLAWWFAHRYKNNAPGRLVRLSLEDIHQEMMTEVISAIVTYSDAPEDELLRIAKTCMRNRMKELLSMEYGTHRADAHLYELPEDPQFKPFIDDVVLGDDGGFDLLNLKYEIEELGPLARAAAEMVVEGNSRLTFELLLADLRRSYVYRGGRWKLAVKSYMLARALGVTTREMKEVYTEIRHMLRGL